MKCRVLLQPFLALSLVLAVAACHTGRTPELRVLGVQDAPRSTSNEVVIVQVTNPANRPMRLTRLDYVFASSSGVTVSEGQLPLSRDVPAGAAIVVEIPLEVSSDVADDALLTLRGRLTAVADEIVKTFRVSAQVQATPASTK
jgi:LEA14-like dessication related protein